MIGAAIVAGELARLTDNSLRRADELGQRPRSHRLRGDDCLAHAALVFRDLVNMATLKIPLHGNGVVTREGIIKARRPVITKFARAITEAIHSIKADREGTKSIIGKYTKFTDPEGLERTYKNYTSVLLDVPYPDPAGIKTLLDDMAPRNAKAAAADPKNFVDQSFVQEMETSGFINS